jgi:hypothetical protein
MTEIFDFRKEKEKRDNPEGLQVGESCYVLDYKKKIDRYRQVLIKSINGKFATVEMFDNPNDSIIVDLSNGSKFEVHSLKKEGEIPLSSLSRVEKKK